MSDLHPLIPRRPVPPLAVATLDGAVWHLGEPPRDSLSLIVFYRGLHCPACAAYLQDLHHRLDRFEERGVEVIAVSMDSIERARTARDRWRLGRLRIGYGLDPLQARRWGLFLSQGQGRTGGIAEPPLFSEPGLFIVRADGRLLLSIVQTTPFARPPFAEVLKAVDAALASGQPGHGEVADLADVMETAPPAGRGGQSGRMAEGER